MASHRSLGRLSATVRVSALTATFVVRRRPWPAHRCSDIGGLALRENLVEGVPSHACERRVCVLAIRYSGDAHVERPAHASPKRGLVGVEGSEKGVSVGLVEQPLSCDEVARWVGDAAVLEVRDGD